MVGVADSHGTDLAQSLSDGRLALAFSPCKVLLKPSPLSQRRPDRLMPARQDVLTAGIPMGNRGVTGGTTDERLAPRLLAARDEYSVEEDTTRPRVPPPAARGPSL
jgi:hypothetical protein